MNQTKFIYMMNKVQPVEVRDAGSGTIIVELRKGVEISHSYLSGNCMEIYFVDTNKKFKLRSQHDLEEIVRIHLEEKNFVEPAMVYCLEYLKEVK